MTATPEPVEIPPPPPGQRVRWLRAVRSLRELIASPDETDKAMDLTLAIGARDFERHFQRFAACPSGRALLAARPSLADALSDRAALEALPEASFGRTYLAYLDRNGFTPTGILELQHRTQARWEAEEGAPPLDPVRGWFRDRLTLAHDLFHVLTDYDTDGAGEATLLAFTLPQIGGRANLLLTLGAAFEVWRQVGIAWLRYDLAAWRRGRHATWLPALPWEELLPLRLETVRARAGVAPTAETHPAGVLRGRGDDAPFHFEPV